jgi:hypothetical protein
MSYCKKPLPCSLKITHHYQVIRHSYMSISNLGILKGLNTGLYSLQRSYAGTKMKTLVRYIIELSNHVIVQMIAQFYFIIFYRKRIHTYTLNLDDLKLHDIEQEFMFRRHAFGLRLFNFDLRKD